MTTEHETVGDVSRLETLISEYWCLAYAEGKEGRTHDTEDGAAQRKWSEIQAAIRRIERAHARESAAQVGVPVGCASVERSFEYDTATRMHTPTVIVRMLPCNADDSDAWRRRDALAAMLSAAPAPAAEPEAETLAEMCAAGRARRGWTLRQAEDETGVSNALISQIETGKQTNPTLRVLSALTRAYNLQPSRVLSAGDAEPAPQPAPSDAPASPQAAQGDGPLATGKVNGYLPRQRAVEIRLDADVPAWISAMPAPEVMIVLRGQQPAAAKPVGGARPEDLGGMTGAELAGGDA